MIAAVDVEGAFRGPIGYHRHLRGFVREFHRRGIAVRLWDIGDRFGEVRRESWQDPFFESLTRPVGARVLLQSRMPHLTARRSDRAVVNLTTFEATRIPDRWVARCRDHAFTVVTTDVCRRAWIDSGAPPERLRVCPLGVDPPPDAVEPFAFRLADGRRVEQFRVRFLNITAVGARKNLPGLLRVWLRATDRSDDAVLILKLIFYHAGDFTYLMDQVDAIERAEGKRFADAAPIHSFLRVFPDCEMPRLFAAATHYVSLSHGEGWDLPMIEAAAAGLRLIAPDHSAYQTYLDRSVARLIPSREVPVVFPFYGPTAALFDGANWWEPDEDAAVAAIRDAIAGRDTPTASARERVLRDFTWERAADRMVEILTEAEAMAPPQRRRPLLRAYIGR